MKFDVVIAGGGFAGAYCARALGRALGRASGTARVALIAERNVLIFQPMLAEVVGGALSPQDVVNPLRQFCRGVTVLQGRIHAIDHGRREVTVDGGRFTRNQVIGYEHLVVTLGQITDLSKVPGMTEYGWPMKTVSDALRLRSALINRLEEANLVEDPVVRTRLLTFVIVGGGYTGVETAGQVHAFVTESLGLYSRLQGTRPRVVLVHSQSQLLTEIGPELGAYARQVLERNHVEVKLNTRVTEVTATRAMLNDGTTLEAGTLVSTIGNAPNPVVLDLCRQLGLEPDRGRIPVNAHLRTEAHPTVWGAGDCARVPWNDRGTEKTSPPTAQFAMRQGRRLGLNLACVLKGGATQPFRYRYLGQLATIGSREAVAEVLGFHFRGFFAWWLWRTLYLAKLPGILRRLRVMVDWTFELIFSRDISLVQPPPEDLLRAIHMEQGEGLFERGEKSRAFYYVRRGGIVLTDEHGTETHLGSGSVLDQALLGDHDTWLHSARASESSDLIVIRGKAYELLRQELRLTRRNPAAAPDADPAQIPPKIA